MDVMEYLSKEPEKYHQQLTNKTVFKSFKLMEI